jgi:bacteriocin biosynthesis cyclodehydratase domain-containing protein
MTCTGTTTDKGAKMPDLRKQTVRNDVRVIVHGADAVELRSGVWNSNSVTIADEEHKGKLADIVLALADGGEAPSVARRTGSTVDEVLSVVEVLLANDLLMPAGEPSTWAQAPYAAQRTLGMGAADRVIPDRAILLSPRDHGELCQAVLATRERSAVSFADEKLITQLTERDLFLDADGFALTATDAYESWRGAVVAVVWPELHPLLLGNLNRLAHLVGFTLLCGVADGAFGIVGPTVVPSVTACYACAETRVLDAMRDHTLYTDYRRALAEGRVHAKATSVDPFQALIVSFTACELASLLTMGTAFTCGRLLTIYGPTMEILFHELAVVPGCPVCGTDSAYDSPLYADLKGYLEAILGPGPGMQP